MIIDPLHERPPYNHRRVYKFTWQRSHGPEIVAEVRADGRGVWSASAWLRHNPTGVVRSPTPIHSRHGACTTADALARQTFDHVCDATACGDWLPLDVSLPTR